MSDQTETANTKEPTASETAEATTSRTRVRTRERRVTRTTREDEGTTTQEPDAPAGQAASTSEGSTSEGGQAEDDHAGGPGRIRRRRRRRTVTTEDAQDAGTPQDGHGNDDTTSDAAGAQSKKQSESKPSEKRSTAKDSKESNEGAERRNKDTAAKGNKGGQGGKQAQGQKSKGGAAKGGAAKGGAAKGDESKGDESKGGESKGGESKGGAAKSDEKQRKDDGDGGTSRVQASRSRGRSGRGGGRGKGRKPVGTVSDATRRAINEGPPRRMMVTVGEERTQIAVLEQRTLMEHYVTRKADVSYVGNIYLGRVQNVLPGMEAAFVDIGKGRNGVLYAGEVNYDEADLDGDVPRIEEQLKPGQTVLVQVTKDPMGTKGARLTQQLSIAGRYCVLAPGDGMLGISRKLPDDERDRLRKILKDVKPQEYGLIVRTAAEDADAEQLKADVDRLVRKWEAISKRAEDAKALDSVYAEPNLVIRVIRDIFGPEYTELVVDNAELAGEVKEYLSDVAPDMVDKVQVHESGQKLFDEYEISTQIRRALEKKVWLKSGGYLIIEKTEAMWVIDVNTGKFVGKDNLEETVLRNNLEAAEEIAHQLRLRDMGGIIVIDFVDMMVSSNRDEVLKRFKRELARDKTKSRVMDISKLGLVQMTRKNVSHGLTETFTSRCETCEGRGATIAEDFS